jgi:hypothetical protein
LESAVNSDWANATWLIQTTGVEIGRVKHDGVFVGFGLAGWQGMMSSPLRVAKISTGRRFVWE